MFNILNPLNIFKKNDEKTKISSSDNVSNKNILDRVGDITSSVKGKVKEGIEEYSTIREKFKDLRKSNYELGMWHFENGKLQDAILRFKIMGLIWPNYLEGRYQLAYCLALQEKNSKAMKVLDNILTKDSGFTKASELKNKIDGGEIKKDVEDFKKKYSKKKPESMVKNVEEKNLKGVDDSEEQE